MGRPSLLVASPSLLFGIGRRWGLGAFTVLAKADQLRPLAFRFRLELGKLRSGVGRGFAIRFAQRRQLGTGRLQLRRQVSGPRVGIGQLLSGLVAALLGLGKQSARLIQVLTV